MAEQDNTETGGIQFIMKTSNPSIIKVVGVGGGGGNAVTHMYNEGIHDVTYVLCNTDKKALSDSARASEPETARSVAVRLLWTVLIRSRNSSTTAPEWFSSRLVWAVAQALALLLS